MSNLRRVFAFWVAVAVFLPVVKRAQAQTASVSITIPPTGVQRDHQDGAGTVPLSQINFKDCLNEDVIKFTLNLGAGASNYALEVWAGTSCEMKLNRTGATATCWKVAVGTPNNLVFSINVPVRDLLFGRTSGKSIGGASTTGGTGGTEATAGTGGTTGGTDTTAGTGGNDTAATAGDANSGGTGGTSGNAGAATSPGDTPPACRPTSVAVSAQPLVLTFLLVDAGEDSVGFTTWKSSYKLNAPAPPTGVVSGIGENIAPLKWMPVTTSPDQTINGYQFFCDPAPGKAGALEANVLPGPGDPLPGSCADSLVLIKGTHADDKYKCGTADKTASRGDATGLLNNVAYNVAVAATDTYRNVGVISAPVCAIPQPVTGFFEAYRGAGGEAGGGFCSFSRRQQPLIWFTLLGLGSCLVLRRRRAA